MKTNFLQITAKRLGSHINDVTLTTRMAGDKLPIVIMNWYDPTLNNISPQTWGLSKMFPEVESLHSQLVATQATPGTYLWSVADGGERFYVSAVLPWENPQEFYLRLIKEVIEYVGEGVKVFSPILPNEVIPYCNIEWFNNTILATDELDATLYLSTSKIDSFIIFPYGYINTNFINHSTIPLFPQMPNNSFDAHTEHRQSISMRSPSKIWVTPKNTSLKHIIVTRN